jgi:tetratricopeptide (TPR) repeat protein
VVVAWLLVALTPLLALMLALAQRAALGAQADTAMAAAASLYQAGDPALAQQAYAQLAAQGGGGETLFHNWGAAALRAGDLETAVAALEQAQALAPRNGQVAAALDTARSAVPAESVAVESSNVPAWLPAQITEPIAQRLNRDELALVALGLWVLLAALMLAALAPGRALAGRRLRIGALLVALPVVVLLALSAAALLL